MLDQSNLVYEDFFEQLAENENFNITRIDENTYTAENIPDEFAIVEIKPNETDIFKTIITSKEGINTNFYTPITDALTEVRNELILEKYSITSEELAQFQSDLAIERVMLSVNAEDSTTKELIKLFSSALTYLLTILIFSKMANEIAQEKQSKSSEYILTTVSAKEYLFAKIFSNIAVLLIQGLFLFVYYFIAISIANIINISTTDLTLSTGVLTTGISVDVILYVFALIAYNVLNLILLCIIQATLSAKTSSTSEAGNTVSLLTFLMMAAYIATQYLITPYSKVNLLLSIVSCLPILSAYFIPALMVIGQASIWQIALSFLLLIWIIPFSFQRCAKSFKNGILDYTKKKKEQPKQNLQSLFLTKRKMKHLGFVTGLAIILYVGIQFILSILLQFTLPTLLQNVFTETEITLITQILLQVFSLGLAAAFVFAYCEPKEKNIKPLSKYTKLKIIFIALLIVYVLQFVLSYGLYPALGLDYNVTDMFDVNANSSLLSKIILILSLAVTPAILEELFFRKAIIDFTLPYGKKFALIFSALLFGFLHMNLAQGLFAFIIGILFGAIYLYTKDIKIPMLIHFINNGSAAIEMILPEEYVYIVSGILILILLAGLIFSILTVAKKSSRTKLLTLCKTKVSLKSFKARYQYIFADFTFDIAILLITLMSVLTENILR